MKICSIIFIFIFLAQHTEEDQIFKQVISAKAIKYDKFHYVDYKTLYFPPNLYDLVISIKFIRWNGFLPLCPKSVNITSSFKYGSYPLFKWDSKFVNYAENNQQLNIYILQSQSTNTSITMSLQSPKQGHWFLGSIFDNNDDFEHFVICTAEVRIEMTGMVISFVKEVSLVQSPTLIPLHINDSSNLLIEIKSAEPLSNIKIKLISPKQNVIISFAKDSVPQILTISEAKELKNIYKSGDTVFEISRPQLNLRLLLHVRSEFGSVKDAKLIITYITVNRNKKINFLQSAANVRGETMFIYRFSKSDSVELLSIPIILSHSKIAIQPFYLEPVKDQGGLLSVNVSLSKDHSESSGSVFMYVCISDSGYSNSKDFIEDSIRSKECIKSKMLVTEPKVVTNYSVYFPRWGWWYVTVMVNSSNENTLWKADLAISSKRCNAGCSGHGVCLLNAFDNGLVSSCHCFRPFYGLDCVKKRLHDKSKLQGAIYKRDWLVWSNVAFIPPIIVSVIQRIYLLSIVYSAAAGFSMIYHMCSIDEMDVRSCLLPMDHLVFYDHFAAALSIWASLVTLSTLSSKIQSMLNVSMIFAFIVMGHCIQRSVWMYAVPVIGGMCIIIICWSYRMYHLKCIFPPIDWWIFGLVPGISLVVAAFIYFRLSRFEDYEYFYFHSIWHILIGVSICFLLPNTRRWSKALKKTSSAHLINEGLSTNGKRWRQLKKSINYYLHLDILLDYLILRHPRFSILKSY